MDAFLLGHSVEFSHKGSKGGEVKQGTCMCNCYATRSQRINTKTPCWVHALNRNGQTHDSVIAPWRTLHGGSLHSNSSCITTTTFGWGHVKESYNSKCSAQFILVSILCGLERIICACNRPTIHVM